MFTLEEAKKIKQALNLCGHKSGCEECTYNNVKYCQDSLNTDAYNLILEYEEAIEQLESECDKQYEQAEADILGNMANGGTSCHWCIEQHRQNAIKEFAERLVAIYENDKRYDRPYAHTLVRTLFCNIDNLVKETVGEG